MANHKSIALTGSELLNMLDRDDSNRAVERENNVRPSDFVLWLVSWPSHVITPRYNSDASYQRVGRAKTNRGKRLIAKRFEAECYGEF